MQEQEFRRLVEATFVQIEKGLEAVDPDVIEPVAAHGSLTLVFADRSTCILSQQPSVRQLWMAFASKGRAWHFDWDAAAACWRDDRNEGAELLALLSDLIEQTTGLTLRLQARCPSSVRRPSVPGDDARREPDTT